MWYLSGMLLKITERIHVRALGLFLESGCCQPGCCSGRQRRSWSATGYNSIWPCISGFDTSTCLQCLHVSKLEWDYTAGTPHEQHVGVDKFGYFYSYVPRTSGNDCLCCQLSFITSGREYTVIEGLDSYSCSRTTQSCHGIFAPRLICL